MDVLHLDDAPTQEDWEELSSYQPAADGFRWADMLDETDIAASHRYTPEVRRMLHTTHAPAQLHELGGLLLITTVREAMRLAVAVLRLQETGELERTASGFRSTTG